MNVLDVPTHAKLHIPPKITLSFKLIIATIFLLEATATHLCTAFRTSRCSRLPQSSCPSQRSHAFLSAIVKRAHRKSARAGKNRVCLHSFLFSEKSHPSVKGISQTRFHSQIVDLMVNLALLSLKHRQGIFT